MGSEHQQCLARQLPQRSHNGLLRAGRAASTGIEVLEEFRGSVSQALSESNYVLPFQFSGSHSFPFNVLTLTMDVL